MTPGRAARRVLQAATLVGRAAVGQHGGVQPVQPASRAARRRRSAVVGWLAAVLTLTGCAPTTGAPAVRPVGSIASTVTLPGAHGDRTALVYHPATAGPGAPLVVVLHGRGGTGASMRSATGWDRLAEREGLVVAYPDGLDRTWNAGACCGRSRDRGVDDVGFLDALAAALHRSDEVGPVHAVGFSNGAELAYAWACARRGTLAGVGAVGGALLVGCPDPAPVSVVAVHGTADTRVPMGGGRGPSGAFYPTLDASLAPFRTAAACPATPTALVDGRARVATWACAGGRTVVRDVVVGMGHSWPGSGADAGRSGGPLDATGFLWAHLRR